MSEILQPPQKQALALMKDLLPEDFKKNLSQDWDIPEGMNAEKINSSKETQIDFLLQKIGDRLESDDPRTKAEAGRMLGYLKQEFNDPDLEKTDRLKRLESKANMYWSEAGGEKANQLYREQFQKNGVNQETTKTQVESLKYPELSEELSEQMKLHEISKNEISQQIEKIKSHLPIIKDICSNKSKEITSLLPLISEKSQSGLELVSKKMSRTLEHFSFTDLEKYVTENASLTAPELSNLDLKHVNQLNQPEAQEYTKGIIEQNNDKIKNFQIAKDSLIKASKKVFAKLTEIGNDLSGLASSASVEDSSIIHKLAEDFDQTLEAVFNIKSITIQKGDKIDYNLMDPQDVEETNDPNLNETVFEVTKKGYRFDPQLSSIDQNMGDILSNPQIIAYKYIKK